MPHQGPGVRCDPWLCVSWTLQGRCHPHCCKPRIAACAHKERERERERERGAETESESRNVCVSWVTDCTPKRTTNHACVINKDNDEAEAVESLQWDISDHCQRPTKPQQQTHGKMKKAMEEIRTHHHRGFPEIDSVQALPIQCRPANQHKRCCRGINMKWESRQTDRHTERERTYVCVHL